MIEVLVYAGIAAAWSASAFGYIACMLTLQYGVPVGVVPLRSIMCSHAYEYVRHQPGSFCRRLLHCRRCEGYFEQNIGVPGAPIAMATERDMLPRASLTKQKR